MNNLLNRTLFVLIFSSLTIVGFTSALQFFWIKYKIENRVDKRLLKEKAYIKEQIKDLQPSTGFSYNTHRASVKFLENSKSITKDTIYNGIVIEDNEKVNYRILNTFVTVGSQEYKVEIRKEIEETNTFIESLYFTYLITLVLVILMFILFKYFLLKNTWLPFFKTLNVLKNSDLQNNLVVFSSQVKIKEFRDLNIELTLLAQKIYDEFQSQKKFIENLNHELMTPLAIIRAKLELIVQSENLKENDLKLVSDIFISIDRLTKLNKSLILISKIENNQFEEMEEVSVIKCINEVLDSFEDQIRVQEIKLRTEMEADIILEVNEMLIFVLLSNLIKNSIFHNLEIGGVVEISVKDNEVIIANTGKDHNLKNDIFERFQTAKKSENSIGLGLSIVKRICELYGFSIRYTQESEKHYMVLKVNTTDLLQN